MKKIIQVRIYRGEKYYVAECVDLPVISQGKTLDGVVENIREAIAFISKERRGFERMGYLSRLFYTGQHGSPLLCRGLKY